MSKTIEMQISKSRVLVEGLRRNVSELFGHGITDTDIAGMESDLEQLAAACRECDAIREELSAKVKRMNGILASVKKQFSERKRVIKDCYPQEEWIKYGVTDKR